MIHIKPELILYLSILIYKYPNMAICYLAACTLHELGHITMLHCIKHCNFAVHFSLCGAMIEPDRLGYRQLLLTTVSGPAANMLGLLFRPLSPVFANYNLILGLYNLLPLRILDGGTILHTVLALHCLLPVADKVSQYVEYITLALLWFAAFVGSFHFGLMPLIMVSMITCRCIWDRYLLS